MKIFIKRLDGTDHGIFGHLTLDGSGFNCVTLERHDISIPAGSYKAFLFQSPEHGLVPKLIGVPGRSDIEIHEGNWEKNSKGCILVGENRTFVLGLEGINNSKNTLKKLMDILHGCNDITVTIS